MELWIWGCLQCQEADERESHRSFEQVLATSHYRDGPREGERKRFRRKWQEGSSVHGRLFIEGSRAGIIKESTKAAVEEGHFFELQPAFHCYRTQAPYLLLVLANAD